MIVCMIFWEFVNVSLKEQFKTQYSNSKACFAAVPIPGSWETKDMFNKPILTSY